MSKNKKRIIILVHVILLIVVYVGVYFLCFAKPKLKCTKVMVTDNFSNRKVEYMESYRQNAIEESESTMQNFWKGELPSDDVEDYAVVYLDLEVSNSTILTGYVSKICVDKYSKEDEFLVVTIPRVTGINIGKCTTEKEEKGLGLMVYVAGKTEQEIEDIIHNMVISITYKSAMTGTKIVKTSLKDAPVEITLK